MYMYFLDMATSYQLPYFPPLGLHLAVRIIIGSDCSDECTKSA